MTDYTFHRDGTLTYWSVYDQVWIRRAPMSSIPDQELAAMPRAIRTRIMKKLAA